MWEYWLYKKLYLEFIFFKGIILHLAYTNFWSKFFENTIEEMFVEFIIKYIFGYASNIFIHTQNKNRSKKIQFAHNDEEVDR